jgi:hypothetical protein
MRRALWLAIVCATAAAAGATRTHPGWRQYRRSVAGKRAVAGALGHAAFGQARNAPHEWGRGGFAKRAASSFAQHAVKQTIQTGVAALHHENLRYRRSNRKGTWPRLRHAVKSTFIVPRTGRRRGKTVALGRVSGAMGAGLISRAWQPASAAGLGAGVASGGISVGAEVGANVAREFWPRKPPGARHARARRMRARQTRVRGHARR